MLNYGLHWLINKSDGNFEYVTGQWQHCEAWTICSAAEF